MKTRSGRKYVENPSGVEPLIKPQQKGAKNANLKTTTTDVKQKPTEEKVVNTEAKRTRSKPNTETNANKLVTSPKKSPKKPVINAKKAPIKPVIASEKSQKKEEIKSVDQKSTEPLIKSQPKEAKKGTLRTTTDVKEKPIEEKVVNTEGKRTRSKPNTETTANKLVISPKKSPKKPVINAKKKPVITSKKSPKKAVSSPKKSPEKPVTNEKESLEKQVISPKKPENPILETRRRPKRGEPLETPPELNQIEVKRPVRKLTTRTAAKTKDNKTVEPKEPDLPEEEKVDKKKITVNEKIESKESDSQKEETLEDIKTPDQKSTEPLKDLPETESNEKQSIECKEVGDEKEEKMDIEEVIPTPESKKEIIFVEPEVIPSATTSEPELTSIKLIASQSEMTSIKRKSTDSDEPQKCEAVKRLRVSRFSVLPIPQICGQLYSFGEEIAGELGPRLKRIDDIKLKSNEPSIVTDRDGLTLDNIVSVVCGAMHSSCLSSEGEVINFGCNDDSALGRDTQTGSDETEDSIDVDESEEKEAKTPKLVSGVPPVVKITAGDMHTCVLCKEGSVYVWGNFKDESKKLGLFADSPKNTNSDDFSATTLPKQIQLDSKIVDIASGCHHILLLTEDGDVMSFGEGSKGQLGRIKDNELQSIAKERSLFLSPQKVEFGVGVVIEKIWADHWSSYAKSTSGDIYVWGLNNYHQLGFKSSGSVKVTNSDPNESQTSINLIIELKPTKAEKMPKNIVMISNGQHHMLALDSDGKVFSCGSNTYGKLGYKTDSSDLAVESPQMISKESFNGQKVTHIACGEFCSFAITESGHLMSWGQGSAHIGSEDFEDIEVPTRVKGSLADTIRFISVSSGSQHSLLIGNKTTINGN